MKHFPTLLIEYLFQETSPFNEILFINTDNNGLVKDWLGPEMKYLPSPLKKNILLSEQLPFLLGMVPLVINPTVLPNIEIKPHNIADIHILKDEHGDHWIVIINKTEDAEILQRFIQNHNEETLRRESIKKNSSSQNLPFGYIDALDYVAFECFNEDTFLLRSDLPEWFDNSYIGEKFKKQKVNIIDSIPFLEYFIVEAKSVWEQNNKTRLVSVPYTESTLDGKEIYIQATALKLGNRNYLLLNKMGNDYTMRQEIIQKARELKLTYEKLQKTDRKLKELLQFKNQFVSIVSHDFRSPIASLLNIANLFLHNEELLNKFDDFHQTMLQSIYDELKKLLDYNSKLYHWSNLELGNFKLDINRIDFSHILISSHQVYRDQLKEKAINLVIEIPDETYIEVDEPLFSQVINNLIGNAIKFTPEKGMIHISVIESETNIEINIQDSGVGMSEEIAESIFDGQRNKSTRGTLGEKGTGLGLGIVKRIIDAHAFTINVHSEIDKGTQFKIKIPKK